PPSASYRASKFVRRNKGPVIAGALLAVAVIVGLVGTSVGFVKANVQRKRADLEAAEAISEKQRADTKAEEALAAEAVAIRNAYSANMLSACSAMSLNQLGAARGFLEAAPGALRGWEWRVLNSRLDTSVRSLACPMPDWKQGEDVWATRLMAHPDGNSIFTIRAAQNDAAQRWDLRTGTLLARFARPAHSAPDPFTQTFFSLSPDASRLWAYCGTTANVSQCSVAAWDLHTGNQIIRTELPLVGDADGV